VAGRHAGRLGSRVVGIAKEDSYGELPEPSRRDNFRLSDEYVTTATHDVAQQLSEAGVRLAFVLNNVFR
jgi:hypothetical protein